MLRSLSAFNFRKIENKTFEFENGLNVLRGRNESSKSTTLQAIAYALFGAQALPEPVADVVTWGHEPKDLRVELTMNSGDVFKRGPTGAEVWRDGKVFVTGQKEVTKHAEMLFGASAAIAPKLMFASQGKITGALDDGAAALSVLIENLAGFEVFDTLLEAAQTKLQLGSPKLTEERLNNARSSLSALAESLPEKPASIDEAIAEAKAALLVKGNSHPALEAKVAAARSRYERCADLCIEKRSLDAKIETAVAAVASVSAQIATTKKSLVKVDAAEIERLKRLVAEADNYTATLAAWNKFQAVPTERFPGTKAEYERKMADLSAEKWGIAEQQKGVSAKIAKLQSKRINHDACDKCGQDITHLEHVKTTNAQIDEQLTQLMPALVELDESFTSICAMETDLAKFRKIEVPTSLGGFVEFDESTFPATLTWKNGVVTVNTPVAPRAELAQLEATAKTTASALSQLEMLDKQKANANANLINLQAMLDKVLWPTGDELMAVSKEHEDLNTKLVLLSSELAMAQINIDYGLKQYENALQAWRVNAMQVAYAEKVVAQCEADLAELGFNNALVAKLRKIRPVIANKVWNTFLASASAMFSSIRGFQSTLTKDAAGFKCNGTSAQSLSGSAKDALGLALRVALIRTFVPHCRLLVVDEPCQGADESRTGAMIGFIAATGFGQTILVTHENISGAVAENIIELTGE